MSDRGAYRATYSVMLDTDEFRQLSSDARLVLHTIKITRLNNMAGIFVCRDEDLSTISGQSGLAIGRVSKAIRILIDTQWIAYREGILWIRNQLKFTPGVSLKNPKHKVGVENILKSLWKSEIVANFCEYYDLTYPFDRVSIPIRYKDTDTEERREIRKRDTDTEEKEKKKKRERKKEKEKEISPPEAGPRKRKVPDAEHGRLIQYWCDLYKERFSNNYDFKGTKEGPIIKRLLKTFGFEKSCDMMETFLSTDDEFYRKAGWTLGVLSSQTNKLIQKPILANDPLSKFSDAAKQTILNMKEILEKDRQDAITGET